LAGSNDPYGPYELAKREKGETILRPNREFPLRKAYIQKVILKSYENQEQLVKAAKNGDITASADFTETPPRQMVEQELQLPRFQVLIFNMAKQNFKDAANRKRIIQGAYGPAVSYTLLTSQSGLASDLADQFAADLSDKGITITVQKKSGSMLQKEDIAKREFDLLLYGINYGATRDYYPFWHSNQSGTNGLNISGVKDKILDGLLEAAHSESDEIKRDTLNKQIESYLNDNSFQKILNQESYQFWINKSVKGVKYAKIDEGNDRFNLLWQWYFKTTKTKQPS
jgi:ABC-type transport system substrate-binding protein